MMTSKAIPIAMAVVLALAALPAHALFIETSYVGHRTDPDLWQWGHEDYSRITGDPLSSTVAQISAVGVDVWDLQLTNLSPVATSAPADILQGVFFTLNEGVTITPRSRVELGGGSEFISGGPPVGPPNGPPNGPPGGVGPPNGGPPEPPDDDDALQGWAFRNDLATGDANPFNRVYGSTHGIANPGLDTFGPSDTFAEWLPELELDPRVVWRSHQRAGSYGIVSAGTADNPGPPLVGDYVRNSLVFRFDAPGLVPHEHIDNVVFHYGTTANVIPEPATMTLLGLGLAGLGARRFVRRKK